MHSEFPLFIVAFSSIKISKKTFLFETISKLFHGEIDFLKMTTA